jgi:hypothetical protein
MGHAKVAEVEGFINSAIDRLSAAGKIPAGCCLEDKTIGDHLRGLSCHEAFNYPDTEEGKNMLVSDYALLVQAGSERVAPLFQPLAAAEGGESTTTSLSLTECQVAKTGEHYPVEPQVSAFYTPASLDHLRPATLFVSPNVQQIPKWIMRTVAAQEVYPGRHLQASAGQEDGHMPMWRKACGTHTAFEEGWALYGAKLAREVKFFSTDADDSDDFDLLGYLVTMQLHAARCVVDTGIHHYDWTREQASDYLTAHSSLFPSSVAKEVERTCVAPGQAVTHMIGERKISDLRTLVSDDCISKEVEFNLAQFHTVVLSSGSMSLAQLEDRVKHHYQVGVVSEPVDCVVPEVNLPHVVVQTKVDHEREHLRRPLPEEVEALHAEYSDLHHALRENGLMGQRNDGRQYMDYIMRFVEHGITKPEQLNGVSPAILQEIGLTTQERRLYALVFK